MNTTTEMLHPCMYVAARRLAASFTETYQQKGLDLKALTSLLLLAIIQVDNQFSPELANGE